jgi:hypothetical protein
MRHRGFELRAAGKGTKALTTALAIWICWRRARVLVDANPDVRSEPKQNKKESTYSSDKDSTSDLWRQNKRTNRQV